jgi:hypothetical protein
MRSLRIGIVLRGLLVEERLFTGPVTLGQSLRCALSIPSDGMPREHTLFTVDQGRFVLHLTPEMETRLAGVTDGVVGPGGRGRIMIGDASILFQEIATPPAAPRPQLPASIRGTLSDRIDRRLAAIIGASLLLHIGIAAYAWSTDRVLPPLGMSTAMRDYVPQTTMDVELPDLPLTPPTEAPATATPVSPVQTPAPIVHRTHVTTSHGPTQPARLQDDDALRMASILTGANETPNGPSDLHPRQPGADLDKQLEDASHHTVVIGNGDHTSRTQREHIGTDPRIPGIDDQTLTRTQHHEEVPVRITLDRPKPDQPTTLTPDSVVDKIRDAYMNGLERCYRKALVADASLSGKVPISFTVTSRGQVSDPEAAGVNEQLDACITGQMSSWHFTIPRDKDGQPTDVSFHVILALRPS